MADDVKVPQETWNPRADLQQLVFESQLDGGDAAAASSRLLREHALLATQSICHLSAYSMVEKVRLEASKYIVDRVLSQSADHDVQIRQAQAQMVGQAMFMAIRSLGLRFGFDPDSPEVKALTREAITELVVTEG
jgi:hypothetical protein